MQYFYCSTYCTISIPLGCVLLLFKLTSVINVKRQLKIDSIYKDLIKETEKKTAFFRDL